MPSSIQDIVDSPSLHTRLLSGARGSGNPVRWAHVCELADPTEWLGEGDIVMTTGIGIPVDAEAQRDYVVRLAKAKIAGLMIGENMQAPSSLEALQHASEQLGFPLLMTHYAVPFSAVTKFIMEASRQQEFERRNAVNRLYESARLGLRGIGMKALLQRLRKDVMADLYLFDSKSLAPWIEGIESLPIGWHEALAGRRSDRRGLVVRRTDSDSKQEALVMELPNQLTCELLACNSELLDYGVLQHVAAVLGIELERIQVEQERQLRLGSELLDDLLQFRLAERQALERLEPLQGDLSAAVIVITRGADAIANWVKRLHRTQAKFIARTQGSELIVLLADVTFAEQVQGLLNSPMGVSNGLEHPGRIGEALREARLAFAHSSQQRPLVFYADAQTSSPWLPRSVEEAVRVHRSVLGPLADYDLQQGAQLQHTLRVFLEQNRSWQKAAQVLCVHKQTLVYRVRRIEEITGRSLDNTGDVSVFWIALQAAAIAAGSSLT